MSRFALILLLASFATSAEIIDTDHFVFHLYDGLDAAAVFAIVTGLEGNYERLTTKYQPKGMPKINVHLFDDVETLKKEGPHAEPAGFGFVTRDGEDAHIWLLVLDETEIDMMQERFRREKVFATTDGRRVVDPVDSAIHEFVHLVTVYVDDRIGNNPRWLWESIALYEVGHIFDPKVNAGSLENIRRPFADLEQDARLYLIGGAITDFVVRRWGDSAVRQLIETQGDTKAVLGLPQAAFEEAFWDSLNAS